MRAPWTRGRRLVLFFGLSIIAGRALASPPQASSAPLPNAKQAAENILKYLKARAQHPSFSAAVLVERRKEILARTAFGLADLELGSPLTPDHIFRIGSLTKAFTATAILRLHERSKLDLGRSVCDFVKNCPPEWQPVTLEHLLSHTSGIPDLFGNLDAVPVDQTRAEVDRIIAKGGALSLKSPAGTKYAYSNFNYVLLGYVLEVVSGEPWESFLLTGVIDPASMPDTRYDDVWAVVPRRVHGYEWKDGKPRITRYTDHAAYAAGGLRSTLDDLRRWHNRYWSGVIISQDSIRNATTPRLGNYGLGWQITRHFGRTLHNHTGGMRGFASHLAYYPDEDLLVIVLSNFEQENTKGTACDLASIALGVGPGPGHDAPWLNRPNDERCGVKDLEQSTK
jgi:CubicO group peptidase (beta-lactamase class C family)